MTGDRHVNRSRHNNAAQPDQRGLPIIDIDHFKTINDSFGHAAGDVVIAEVDGRITTGLGSNRISARWGSDEFSVLLPESAPNLLHTAVLSVMASTGDGQVALPDGRSVTVNVGGCLVAPGQSLETTVEAADAALYKAKHEGRNRARISEIGMPDLPNVKRQV